MSGTSGVNGSPPAPQTPKEAMKTVATMQVTQKALAQITKALQTAAKPSDESR